MKKAFGLVLILLSLFTYGQETTKKVVYTDNDTPRPVPGQAGVTRRVFSPGHKEVFYVLKENKKIRHGSYQLLDINKEVLVDGYYKNGEKDSLWTEYNRLGTLKSRGSYANGERVGVWEFYNRSGLLEQRFDFTRNILLLDNTLRSLEGKKYKVVTGLDTTETDLERPPVYIGGKTKMQNALSKNFTYPLEAIRNRVSGEVVVSFLINKMGQASNYRVISGIGSGCNEEALRMVQQLPANWLPALHNGQPVEVVHTIRISFQTP